MERRIAEGLVGGEGFAVDASLIEADANRERSVAGSDWNRKRDPEAASGVPDDPRPRRLGCRDRGRAVVRLAAQWTGALRGPGADASARGQCRKSLYRALKTLSFSTKSARSGHRQDVGQ